MPRLSDAPLSPARSTGNGPGSEPPRAACEADCTVATTTSFASCATGSARAPRSTATSASPSRTSARADASSPAVCAVSATSNVFCCERASSTTRSACGPTATTVAFVAPPKPSAAGSTRIPARTATATPAEIHSERSRTRSTISRRATSRTARRVPITGPPHGRGRGASAPPARSGVTRPRGAPRPGRARRVEQRLLVGVRAELDDDRAVVAGHHAGRGDAREPFVARARELDAPAPTAPRRTQLGAPPGRDDASAADDRDRVAQALDELELVAGEHDGHARPRPLAQHVAQDVDAHRVEAGERLVEDEQLGIVDERGAELGALLGAQRERLRAGGR